MTLFAPMRTLSQFVAFVSIEAYMTGAIVSMSSNFFSAQEATPSLLSVRSYVCFVCMAVRPQTSRLLSLTRMLFEKPTPYVLYVSSTDRAVGVTPVTSHERSSFTYQPARYHWLAALLFAK